MDHYSNARPYTVRMKKRRMTATTLVVLLSIVLIAGIIAFSPIGDYLMEHAVNPVISALRKPKEKDSDIVSALKSQELVTAEPTASPSPVQNSFTIVETPFYLLQMGVYTEQEQAEEQGRKLRAMGAAGMVYADGNVYRVFAAAYRDEESLKKVQSQVRTDGFEATPFITDRNSVHLALKGEKVAVTAVEAAIALISKVPGDLSDLSLSLDKESIDGSQYKESLNVLEEQIQDVLEQFQSIDTDSIKPFQTILEKYRIRISTFLQEHDTISKMNSSDCKLLQIECITDYILFFEQE